MTARISAAWLRGNSKSSLTRDLCREVRFMLPFYIVVALIMYYLIKDYMDWRFK